MFRAKTRQQAIIEAVNSVAAKSSITQLSPGGKARALIEAMASVVGTISADVSDGIMQTLLTDASGMTLDLIAESYGIQRLQAVPPRVESTDNSLRYYVRRGSFGDINAGQNITVPAGTQIRADNANTSTYLLQRGAVVLPAGSSSVYFAADQVGANIGVSIAPGILVKHNFVGYADAIFESLLVTNDKGVAGRPIESDANLRYRLRTNITAGATGNATSIRIAALAVPGVSDIRILENRAGLGTFDVVVFGIDPSVPASVLQEVQARVDQVTAMGCRAIAISPRLVGVSLRTQIRFRANTAVTEKNRILLTASDALRAYVNDLRPGQDLVINQLVQQILGVSDQIIDIGLPGQPFAELLIWKQNGPNSRRYSHKLVKNYRIREDEDMLIEPFISSPIILVEG